MVNKDKKISELYRKLLQGLSVSELINDMSILVQRSLVLSDLSFRVLAYSTAYPVTDPLWLGNIKRGFCVYEFISEIQKLVPNLTQKKTTDTFSVECDFSAEYKLVSPVIYKDQMIAYLLLLDNGKGIDEDFSEILQHFSSMMTFALQQSPSFHRLFENMVENIIDELFETGDTTVAKNRLDAAGIALPENFYCLSCTISNTSPLNIKYARRTLRQLFDGCILSVQENHVLCLVESTALQRVDLEYNAALKKVISCIGVSPLLSDISNLLRGYNLAERSCKIHEILLKTGNPKYSTEQFVRKYEDYQFHNLLLACPDPAILKDNIHPAIFTLAQYDLKNNSILLKTLRCFLEHNQSIADTAHVLYTHRNTISYRLNRIQELTSINYENYSERFKLECSFIIYDLLEIIQ